MDIYSNPKARFQANRDAAKHHADLVARADLMNALDVAMLQYTHEATVAVSENPAAVAYRLEGAKQFRLTLLGLAVPPNKPAPKDPYNLPKDD